MFLSGREVQELTDFIAATEPARLDAHDWRVLEERVGYLMLDKPDDISGFHNIHLRYGIFVTLGGSLGEARQVLAGVTAGESVIVNAPASLKDGDAVEQAEPLPPAAP